MCFQHAFLPLFTQLANNVEINGLMGFLSEIYDANRTKAEVALVRTSTTLEEALRCKLS